MSEHDDRAMCGACGAVVHKDDLRECQECGDAGCWVCMERDPYLGVDRWLCDECVPPEDDDEEDDL